MAAIETKEEVYDDITLRIALIARSGVSGEITRTTALITILDMIDEMDKRLDAVEGII
jgi:hypothetical protein